MGTMRLRHFPGGLHLAATPDGAMIVSASQDSICFWETSTGKLLRQIKDERDWHRSLLFAPNGEWLAVHMSDESVALLDAVTGQVRKRFAKGGQPLAISPDAKLLVTGTSDGRTQSSIYFWDTSNGKQTVLREDKEIVLPLAAFTRAGDTLVTVDYGGKLCRWNVANRKLEKSIWLAPPYRSAMGISRDAQILATVPPTTPAKIELWDTETARVRAEIEIPDLGRGLAFTPDGKKVVTYSVARNKEGIEADMGAFSLWETATGKLIRRFPIPAVHMLYSMQFMPDNRTLACDALSSVIQLWDTETGQPLLRRPAHDNGIGSVAFSPDGRSLLSGSWDGSVRLWDTASGAFKSTLTDQYWSTKPNFAVLPDGQVLLALKSDGALHLLDAVTGKEARRLTLDPKRDQAKRLTFLATDGRTVIAYSDRQGSAPAEEGLHAQFDAWELQTGKVLFSRPGDGTSSKFLAFSPDWTQYVSYDGLPGGPSGPRRRGFDDAPATFEVILKETSTGRRLLALSQPEQFDFVQGFTPDGRTLVTATHRQGPKFDDRHWLHFWELATGKERLTIACPDIGSQFRALCISSAPNGRILATSRCDGSLLLWDLATGTEILQRKGSDALADCLAFSPDGKLLASGHRDTTILTWDLSMVQQRPQAAPSSTDERSAETWFAQLRDADAPKAYAASWKLVASANDAVRMLRGHLSATPGVPPEKLRQLVDDLDSNQFARRQTASRELADLEELALPALQEALKSDVSPEKRQRIQALLGGPGGIRSPATLQAIRAVEVLEQVGTPEAKELLATLARGAPAARLTQEAKGSLGRLTRRGFANH